MSKSSFLMNESSLLMIRIWTGFQAPGYPLRFVYVRRGMEYTIIETGAKLWKFRIPIGKLMMAG